MPWGHHRTATIAAQLNRFLPNRRIANSTTADLKVIERFTRIDEETILYEFTIDDPTTYTQPWGGELPFKQFRDYLYEFACHEGNYSMAAMLSVARYVESQAEHNRR